MFFDISARRQSAPEKIHQPVQLIKPPVAGIRVNDETAWRYSAFFACVRIISETIAFLPWHVYQRSGSRRIPYAEHPLDRVLHIHPNDELPPYYFKELLQRCVLGKGNFIAEVERDRAGQILALWPLEWDFANLDRDSRGRLVYEYSSPGLPKQTFLPRDIYHVRGPSRDGIVGQSMIELARESISLGLASHAFGAGFLGNGAMPSLVITNVEGKAKVNPEGVENLLKTWNKRNKGAEKMRGTEYLDPGLDVKEFGFTAKDSQFIETADFAITDICRWFRIPPHKLAKLERATWANIESQNVEFVTDAILPGCSRMEASADHTLLRPDEFDLYTRINVRGLMRGDSAARKEYYKDLFDMGVLSIDEIRELEDMDALESGGDLRVVPSNMTTLERMKSGQLSNKPAGNASVAAVLQETAERMTRNELIKIRALTAAPSQDEIAKAYIEHAQLCVDAFRKIALAVAESLGREGGDIEQNLKVFFGDWAAQSADEIYHALIRGEEKMVLKSWEYSKAEKLAARLVDFLREC